MAVFGVPVGHVQLHEVLELGKSPHVRRDYRCSPQHDVSSGGPLFETCSKFGDETTKK